MSKTEATSSPDAPAPNEPRRVDGDALRVDNQLAEPLPTLPASAPRPARDLDDSWALTGGMPIPEVPGVTDTGPEPPMLTPSQAGAALPSAPVVGVGRDASAAARVAALRALGAKTMQGVGPAPLGKGRTPAAVNPDAPTLTPPPISPQHLQEAARQPAHFGAAAPQYLSTAMTQSSRHRRAPPRRCTLMIHLRCCGSPPTHRRYRCKRSTPA
jgi:hypothetical protein